MENKLDVLTKKLYDEGVDKARRESEKIISDAKAEAARLLAEAEARVQERLAQAGEEADHLKKKAESEMALSARQAVTALKQEITGLISSAVADGMAKTGFEDKAFVQELLAEIVKKWDAGAGNMNLEVLLPAEEQEKFRSYVAGKYKELLDKGLEIKVSGMQEAFIIQPKDGSYQIAFSEELFEAFFNQYIRSFTKALLYK